MILVERTFTADIVDPKMINPDGTVDTELFSSMRVFAMTNYMMSLGIPLPTVMTTMAAAPEYDQTAKLAGKIIYATTLFVHEPDNRATVRWVYLFDSMESYLDRLHVGWGFPSTFKDEDIDCTPWGITTTFKLTQV